MAMLIRPLVVVSAAVWLARTLLRHRGERRERHHADDLLDESIDETFPASDPTASQDFDIPVNRQ